MHRQIVEKIKDKLTEYFTEHKPAIEPNSTAEYNVDTLPSRKLASLS